MVGGRGPLVLTLRVTERLSPDASARLTALARGAAALLPGSPRAGLSW